MRSTFALQDEVIFRLKAAAALLNVSENTLRNHLRESGLEIQRANRKNPASPAVRLFSIGDVFRLAQWRREQELVKKVANDGPIVIAVDLIKGGVGKSTTTCELGIQLALQGYRVLMIDLDVQANLTQLMGYESDLTLEEAAEHGLAEEAIVNGTFATLCTQYMESRNGRTGIKDMSSLIKRPFGPHGPALIPSDTYIGDLEQAFTFAKGVRELTFRHLIKDAMAGQIPGLNTGEFDFILFDCPPSVSFSSTNAIAAADVVVAPIRMDAFAVKGLSRLVSEINGLGTQNAAVRPHLIILPTHYSTNITRVSRMQQQLQAYKENLSPTVISTSELFPKTQENYLPLTLQMPTSSPVGEYRLFAEFLLNVCAKIKTRQPARAVATAEA